MGLIPPPLERNDVKKTALLENDGFPKWTTKNYIDFENTREVGMDSCIYEEGNITEV